VSGEAKGGACRAPPDDTRRGGRDKRRHDGYGLANHVWGGSSIMQMLRAVLIVLALPVAALATEPYPSHSIRMVVPFPPAGIADLSARIVGDGLRAKFTQTIVVENKPGANGLLGLRELLKAEPDGYTVMAGTVGSAVINYAMDTHAPFDPARDMVPIAGTAEYATAMVVNTKLPVNSVQDFIAYAKARPGKLSFGSTGVGALDYLSAELFMKATGIEMVHVPYKGGPAALNDLLSGSIDVIFEVFPVVMEQIRSGAIKGLAVSSSYRQPSLPDVPTFAEAGLPGVTITGWVGIYGPPGIAAEAREALGRAIVDVVRQDDTKRKFRAIGFEPTGQGVAEFSALHATEITRWVKFLAEIGLRK
jgi:tripartite-type tricarboxylate transporter receptor subunit TctC